MNNKTYSDDEAREILKRAVDFQEREDFQYNQQQLMDLGREMGLSNDAIVKAEQDWQRTRREVPVTATAALHDTTGVMAGEETAFQRHRMWEFQIHFVAYISTVLLVLVINLLTNGLTFPWFLFVALGWGIGVFPHYLVARKTDGEEYEGAFDQWLDKREDRLASRRRRIKRLEDEQA